MALTSPLNIDKIYMIHHRGDQGEHMVLYVRGDNRMIIGSSQGGIVKFGEDPEKPLTRCFPEETSGEEYAKGLCREYCGRDDVTFYQEEGNPIVRTAQQMPTRRM